MSAVDPIGQFVSLFARAGTNAPFDHVAVTLATSTRDGHPSARIVLLRGVDARGFVFYTNYTSRKARELALNAYAAICCYWPWLDEQARIEGIVERVAEDESDEYFASRPRGSQIGAWASAQSAALASRAQLDERIQEIGARFAGTVVPRPPFWSGYRVLASSIEFWTRDESRLHARVLFERAGSEWTRSLLFP